MRKLIIVSVGVALLCSAAPAWAYLVEAEGINDPSQDVLEFPFSEWHELGNNPPFPTNEWIDSSWQETGFQPCQENTDDPLIANAEVTIVNRTDISWYELIYVADPETSLENYDGTVNGELAFWIDATGANVPLIYEDNPDGIFEPGETWVFVIQDYVNSLGGTAAALDSLGIAGSSTGFPPSTGSIIALPEPASLLLILVAPLLIRRRR
jgi:hypothetical protein